MFNKCEIEIEFEFGSVNGEYMNVEIVNGNNTTVVIPENRRYRAAITLPTRLSITTSGKNPRYHTVLRNGEIVEDMFVKITKFTIDKQPLNEIFLHKKITLSALDGSKHTTNYFGFNGTADIDFLEDNVFIQYVMLNTDV